MPRGGGHGSGQGRSTVTPCVAPTPPPGGGRPVHLLAAMDHTGRTVLAQQQVGGARTAEDWISERRIGWERRLDRLGDYLAEQPDDPDQRRSL